jgi:pimeloyl-ACP methyl ester carboxylesterase
LHHDPSLSTPVPPADATWQAVPRSPVRYARSSDGTNIAYQVAGEGPIDILAIAGFVSHLDLWWNAPTDRLVRRLSSMGRLICFDKRGMGLSDRPDTIRAEQWVDDALAVMDAVGAECPVVLAVSAGAPTALTLAATFPERVRALAIHGGYARTMAADDYDIGHELPLVTSFAAELEAGWGTGVAIEAYAPSLAADPAVRAYWARYQQLSASPRAAMRFLWALLDADVRHLLPDIRTPTLVVHSERDVVVPVAQARYIADHVPGAEMVTIDSDVHLICASDVIEELTDAIEEFLGRAVVPAGSLSP